jgi:hypothetical protein
MGYAISQGFHAYEAKAVIDGCMPSVMKFKHVRGFTYALLGAVYFDKILSKFLVEKIMSFFRGTDDKWLWPDPVMTYGNGILPYSLLRYGHDYSDLTASKFGLKVCKFVEVKCELNDRILGPIGNDGWLAKESNSVPEYSQQPIDTAYMVWAWLAAYQTFNKPKYFEFAKKWMSWFEGNNIKRERMYDSTTLKCFDGIDELGVHHHSGAESNICLILTLQLLKYKITI